MSQSPQTPKTYSRERERKKRHNKEVWGEEASETYSIGPSVKTAPLRLSHKPGTNESRDDVDDLALHRVIRDHQISQFLGIGNRIPH